MAGVTRSFGNSGPLIFIALLLCILHQSLALSGLHKKNDAVSIKDEQRILKNGMAQIISSIPPNYESSASSPGKPPILFLHGSFHGAWCWQEHYIPYFVERGYPCVAFSWRGTGGTPAGKDVTKVKIVEDHCEDFQALLDELPSVLGLDDSDGHQLRPIVVSHSMGGIIVMKYLDELFSKRGSLAKPNEVFSGIASMCSVPPSGNSKTTMRYLLRSPLDAYKITVGFVLKKVITDDEICRDCFFGGKKKISEDGGMIDNFGISDKDLARYQSYFERDSRATLDVSDLAKRAPSKTADKDGRAPFLADLPPCLVIGATNDFIVVRSNEMLNCLPFSMLQIILLHPNTLFLVTQDEIANTETATYYGVDNPVYVDSPHDVMVGKNWENGASALLSWIEDISSS